jgi:hypothetical protein
LRVFFWHVVLPDAGLGRPCGGARLPSRTGPAGRRSPLNGVATNSVSAGANTVRSGALCPHSPAC